LPENRDKTPKNSQKKNKAIPKSGILGNFETREEK